MVILGSFFVFQSVFLQPEPEFGSATDKDAVNIGYIESYQGSVIYRAHLYGFFGQEDVDVNLYTWILDEGVPVKIPIRVPNTHKEMRSLLLDETRIYEDTVKFMMSGAFDGGILNASTFITALNQGVPLVAVAMLGREDETNPGRAFLLRNDVRADSTEDLRGLTFAVCRETPSHMIFFEEFLKETGLVRGEDVTIIEGVDAKQAQQWLQEGVIDGGLWTLAPVRHLVNAGVAYVYRRMDWMEPVNHALLVFNRDYIENHPEKVQKVVNAYVNRVAYEKNLPKKERYDESWDRGLMIEGQFEGMNKVVFEFPPKIRLDLLGKIQNLLLEYEYVDSTVDIADFVDFSFVENALES